MPMGLSNITICLRVVPRPKIALLPDFRITIKSQHALRQKSGPQLLFYLIWVSSKVVYCPVFFSAVFSNFFLIYSPPLQSKMGITSENLLSSYTTRLSQMTCQSCHPVLNWAKPRLTLSNVFSNGPSWGPNPRSASAWLWRSLIWNLQTGKTWMGCRTHLLIQI